MVLHTTPAQMCAPAVYSTFLLGKSFWPFHVSHSGVLFRSDILYLHHMR